MEHRHRRSSPHGESFTSQPPCPVGHFLRFAEELNTTLRTWDRDLLSFKCFPCSQCGCGVVVLQQCNGTADTVCSNRCTTLGDVFNDTLGLCVSNLGVRCLESALKLTTALLNTTTSMSLDEKAGLSHLQIQGVSFGVICVMGLGTMASVLIARKRGLLPNFWKARLCCKGNICNLEVVSPTIKRVVTPRSYLRRHYHSLLQRFNHTETYSPTDPRVTMSMENLSLTPADIPLAEDIEVIRGDRNPYWLIMRGFVTSRGGVLRCQESDVVLEVPSGAIPDTVGRQEIIAKVALVTSRFDFTLTRDELCLSPLVEFLSPGLDQFADYITIRLPHRACLHPDWSFRVHYTHAHGQTQEKWYSVGASGVSHPDGCGKPMSVCSQDSSDITFEVDKTHFIIKTLHFSKYVCAGCGKKRYLNLEAVVFAKYLNLPQRQQVDLNCYVIDTIKDYFHRVKENEGTRPHSERYPIHLKSKEPLHVSVLTEPTYVGDGWPWKAETFGGKRPTTVTIPVRNIVRCCSDAVPYFVTFSLRPNETHRDGLLEMLETLVSYNQRESSVVTTISLAVDLRKLKNTAEHVLNTPSTPKQVTDMDITKVAREIPANKWRYVCRRLLGDDNGADALIDQITTEFGNNVVEQNYQMLRAWLQRKGRNATMSKLCQVLRDCELVQIAEMVDGTLVADIDNGNTASSNVSLVSLNHETTL